jgi:diguanylate cyclase (GGDEF)-like protein
MAAHVDLCRASGPRGALLSLDLDHFKTVNDRLGHPVGDRLIIEVGQSLRAAVRPRDLVARQGGDEFLILLRTGNLADARAVAERVVAAVQRAAAFLEPHGLGVTGSVGVVAFEQFSSEGLSVDVAMIRADVALYAAKAAGRNRLAVFAE